MSQEEFLEKITKLCDEYETSHKNNKIIGVIVRFPRENNDDIVYSWNGESMIRIG